MLYDGDLEPSVYSRQGQVTILDVIAIHPKRDEWKAVHDSSTGLQHRGLRRVSVRVHWSRRTLTVTIAYVVARRQPRLRRIVL